MKKKWATLLLAGVMVLSLAACGSTGNGAASSGSAPSGSVGASSSAASNPASGDLEDTVVIYSTHPEALLEEVSQAFTAATGVKVEYINLKGELADRVESEMANPQADIMYGGDTATYMQLQEKDAFTVSSPDWGDELDGNFKDAGGYWYGTIQTPVMMFYNTDLMSAENAPKDWSDLTDSKYAGQIISRDSLSSSMRSTICNLTDYYTTQDGEAGATAFLQALDSNTKNYYNSGSMMFQAIGKGEAAICFAPLNDIMDNKTNNDMPLQEIDAASGNVVITDCIAALKNSPHPNAAQAFLQFAGSSEIQAQLANDFNRMPTLSSALANSPTWMQTGYKAMSVDWSTIAANQSTWLDNWENNICDSAKEVESAS